jgi:septal ring-binding cell division protein DamX
MYETRWPRPGPAMLVVGVIVGLLVGGLLGISFPASSSDRHTAASTTSQATQPSAQPPRSFFTLVLASPKSSVEARSKLARLQAEGVTGAVILSKADYTDLKTQFAVCAGTYPSRTRADQALQELKAQLPNLTSSPYVRSMRRTG